MEEKTIPLESFLKHITITLHKSKNHSNQPCNFGCNAHCIINYKSNLSLLSIPQHNMLGV